MTADRLHASIGLAHEKTSPASGHDQSENPLMLFEISQVVIGQEHVAALPANKRPDLRQSVRSPRRQYTHLVFMPHAEQQTAGLIHRPVQARDPPQRDAALGLRVSS